MKKLKESRALGFTVFMGERDTVSAVFAGRRGKKSNNNARGSGEMSTCINVRRQDWLDSRAPFQCYTIATTSSQVMADLT